MGMTNEEAINKLMGIEVWHRTSLYSDDIEALHIAIKALEQQPCEDCISRADILDAIETWDKFGINAEQKLIRWQDHYVPYVHLDDVRHAIANMPSVTPKGVTITDFADRCRECGKQKVGKWKRISPAGIYECTNCNQVIMTSDIDCYKYCHGCGVRMEGEE